MKLLLQTLFYIIKKIKQTIWYNPNYNEKMKKKILVKHTLNNTKFKDIVKKINN